MVKDDSLYVIAIVAVVAVVGLVVMATSSSSTVMVAEDLPSMAEESDSSAIAGEAFRTGSSNKLYDRGYGGVSDHDISEGIGSSAGSTQLGTHRMCCGGEVDKYGDVCPRQDNSCSHCECK